MANGFFLGGIQEGMAANAKRDLEERTLASDTSLRSRGLDIQQGTLDRANQQDITKRADEEIANTMSVVTETIKAGITAGRDPAKIQQTVAPLVETAKAIASKVGRNPAALDAQVQATFGAPTATEVGTAAGTTKAATTIAEERALTAAGVDPSRFKEHKDKVSAENALRDDYVKGAKNFETIRDFKDRMDTAPSTGAGDISIVFSYMKLLDPASTVREGEYATAANAGGAFDRAGGMYNKVLSGDQLTPKVRKEIREASEKIFTSAAERHNTQTKQFEEIAKRQGLNPKNVIVDFTAKPASSFNDRFTAATAGGGGAIPPPPKGFNVVPR